MSPLGRFVPLVGQSEQGLEENRAVGNRNGPLIALSFALALNGCGTAVVPRPSAEPASTGTPAPMPSHDAPIVHDWPGVRGGGPVFLDAG